MSQMVEVLSVFFAGMLAGEEFVVRYGVHPALRCLEERVQIRARQSLIRRLRVLVPVIFALTAVTGVVALILGGSAAGAGFRWAGVVALLGWVAVTVVGTVPINKGALDWRPEAPPANWRMLVERWERLDVVRASAAILSFVFVLTAMATQLIGG